MRIMKKAVFLSKRSLRTFVLKYTFYLIFLMSLQCFEVLIIIFGSINDEYFAYYIEDGWHYFRYIYLIGDQISFTMLCLATLIEPVFKGEVIKLYRKYIRPLIVGRENNALD